MSKEAKEQIRAEIEGLQMETKAAIKPSARPKK